VYRDDDIAGVERGVVLRRELAVVQRDIQLLEGHLDELRRSHRLPPQRGWALAAAVVAVVVTAAVLVKRLAPARNREPVVYLPREPLTPAQRCRAGEVGLCYVVLNRGNDDLTEYDYRRLGCLHYGSENSCSYFLRLLEPPRSPLDALAGPALRKAHVRARLNPGPERAMGTLR